MKIILVLSLLFLFAKCSANSLDKHNLATMKNTETITFGAGCFWCVEAVFQELNGVSIVESGYSNGNGKDISYKDICTGTTGYAEVVQVTYDPEIISLETLLSVFFKTHDPTTLNRQGADVGTQYRSGIFYSTESQKKIAEEIIIKLNKEKAYPNPIVTEVTELILYTKAESYHQDYYSNNPNQGYCSRVIQPKVDKFKKVFGEYLK